MPRNLKNGSARDSQRESSAPGSSSDDDHGLIRAKQSDEDKSALFSRFGLARIGLRTTFSAGKAGRDTHPSAKKDLELEHNLRVLRFHYQLTHARNFSTSDKDGTTSR